MDHSRPRAGPRGSDTAWSGCPPWSGGAPSKRCPGRQSSPPGLKTFRGLGPEMMGYWVWETFQNKQIYRKKQQFSCLLSSGFHNNVDFRGQVDLWILYFSGWFGAVSCFLLIMDKLARQVLWIITFRQIRCEEKSRETVTHCLVNNSLGVEENNPLMGWIIPSTSFSYLSTELTTAFSGTHFTSSGSISLR